MELFVAIYRRLENLQRQMWFRIAATVLVLAGCGGYFGAVLAKAHSLNSQRLALSAALSNQNYQRGDEHALSLVNTGKVRVNNREYGGQDYLTRVPLFDEQGNLGNIERLTTIFLLDQQPTWAPQWLVDEPETAWFWSVACVVWLLLIVWMNLAVPFILTIAGTAVPVLIAWAFDKQQLMLALGSIGLLTFTFLLLARVALVALNQPWQIPAVAHTVIKEASRRGLALVFIVLLLVVLPLLPLILDPEQPLRFRIQSYISWGVGLSFAIVAVMTLFFSCASVAFEIRDRQIWQLMTKPLARLNYLLGKWVGVMALNLVILSVAGTCVFAFVQYLSRQPVDLSTQEGQLDAQAVKDEVLTARVGGRPILAQLEPERLQQRVNQIIENDPKLSQMERVPLAERRRIEQRVHNDFYAGQRSIRPNGSREYLFTGLQQARRYASTLTVRYKFYILHDDEHATFNAVFQFNDDPNRIRPATYVPSMAHSFPIPSSFIQEDGTLRVTIHNLNGMGAINWEEGNFELLYKAGDFQGNFIRAILTVWIKLAFLAALGICCATFLSFPVACLLSFTVFTGGIMGPYLAESLEYYGLDTTNMDWSNVGLAIRVVFEWITATIAQGIVFLLSSFGEYKPTQRLVEGRLIEWSSVVFGFFKLAILWSGLAMIIGYSVLRHRQLAIYSGQG